MKVVQTMLEQVGVPLQSLNPGETFRFVKQNYFAADLTGNKIYLVIRPHEALGYQNMYVNLETGEAWSISGPIRPEPVVVVPAEVRV